MNFLFLLIDWAPLIFKRDENWSADDVNTFFLNKDILALFFAYKEERGRFRDGGRCWDNNLSAFWNHFTLLFACVVVPPITVWRLSSERSVHVFCFFLSWSHFRYSGTPVICNQPIHDSFIRSPPVFLFLNVFICFFALVFDFTWSIAFDSFRSSKQRVSFRSLYQTSGPDYWLCSIVRFWHHLCNHYPPPTIQCLMKYEVRDLLLNSFNNM